MLLDIYSIHSLLVTASIWFYDLIFNLIFPQTQRESSPPYSSATQEGRVLKYLRGNVAGTVTGLSTFSSPSPC